MRRIILELSDAQTELLYQVCNSYAFEEELCKRSEVQDAAEFDEEGTYEKLQNISWKIHAAIDLARE